MSHNKSQKSKIKKFRENKPEFTHDFIAVEYPLEIRLSKDAIDFQTLAITLCTPKDIEAYIYGHLFTENIIQHPSDVVRLSIFDSSIALIAEVILLSTLDFSKHLNNRQGLMHSSCGLCGKTQMDDWLNYKYPYQKKSPQSSNKSVHPELIYSLPDKLKQGQETFNKTGGIHACALFDSEGRLLQIMEDIGRHNALDKLLGWSLNQGLIPLEEGIVLLSGRVSFELVHKSLIAGLNHLCAIGAPSTLSIDIARLNQMKLYGFIKKNQFNQYC